MKMPCVKLPRLTDPVASILGLLVIVRVEVEVVENDRVGGREVDSEAAGFGGQDEDEVLVVVVKGVDQGLSALKD